MFSFAPPPLHPRVPHRSNEHAFGVQLLVRIPLERRLNEEVHRQLLHHRHRNEADDNYECPVLMLVWILHGDKAVDGAGGFQR